MEDSVTMGYLRKLEMQKLESILVFCLQPWNFYSYGHFAEIIVDILDEKNIDNQKEWEQKSKLYRNKIKLAKQRSDKSPPKIEYIV